MVHEDFSNVKKHVEWLIPNRLVLAMRQLQLSPELEYVTGTQRVALFSSIQVTNTIVHLFQ